MQPFDYVKAKTLEEASAWLAQGDGQVRAFAGGTDLLILIKGGHIRPAQVVDIKGIEGLDTIAYDPATGLTLGATATMNAIAGHPDVRAHYPLLAEACRSVGTYQIRNRATVGGNLCNASPAADSAPALLCYDAEAAIFGPDGERRLPLAAFLTGPGTTVLGRGELLTGLRLPPPPAGAYGVYHKLGRTKIADLALVGVAVLGYPDAGNASGYGFRIALGAVAPTPIRVPAAEAILAEAVDEAAIAAAAEAAKQAAHPIDDVRASAAYRRAMVQVLARRGIERVLQEVRR